MVLARDRKINNYQKKVLVAYEFEICRNITVIYSFSPQSIL